MVAADPSPTPPTTPTASTPATPNPAPGLQPSLPPSLPPSLRDATTPGLPVFLSTEHWSLLGTRSMTWSEVMSRITIHLTVVSAFLLVLALTAQVSGFSTAFRTMAIGLASAALVMGTLTGIRVNLASREDADLVRAMNRLRHAYLELAPELAPYLTASVHDDERGLMHTYALGHRRNLVLHIVGSTSFFLMVVNAIVAGTLGALVAGAVGAGTPAVVVTGVVVGLGYVMGHLEIGRRVFAAPNVDVRFPHPD